MAVASAAGLPLDSSDLLGEIQIAIPLYVSMVIHTDSAPRHNRHLCGASMTQELPSAINRVMSAATPSKMNSQWPFNLPALSSTMRITARTIPAIPMMSEKEILGMDV